MSYNLYLKLLKLTPCAAQAGLKLFILLSQSPKYVITGMSYHVGSYLLVLYSSLLCIFNRNPYYCFAIMLPLLLRVLLRPRVFFVSETQPITTSL